MLQQTHTYVAIIWSLHRSTFVEVLVLRQKATLGTNILFPFEMSLLLITSKFTIQYEYVDVHMLDRVGRNRLNVFALSTWHLLQLFEVKK